MTVTPTERTAAWRQAGWPTGCGPGFPAARHRPGRPKTAQEQDHNGAEHIQDQYYRQRFVIAISRVETGDQRVVGNELGGDGSADDRAGHNRPRQPAMWAQPQQQ